MKHIKHIVPAALTALSLALTAGSADAQVTNGNFAAGLSGWTSAGDASVNGQGLWLTTASATYADDVDAGLDAAGARNVSGTDPLSVGTGDGSLESFLGVAQGALDPDAANVVYAYEGSAASQAFTAAAGTRLTFQWDLGTLDTSGVDSLADTAFVVIDGQVISLANILAATTPTTDGGDLLHTGWTDFSYTFTTGGDHTLSFGIVDVGDFVDTSTLAIADVNLAAAVPETSGLALMAAGLALVGFARRRRAA